MIVLSSKFKTFLHKLVHDENDSMVCVYHEKIPKYHKLCRNLFVHIYKHV